MRTSVIIVSVIKNRPQAWPSGALASEVPRRLVSNGAESKWKASSGVAGRNPLTTPGMDTALNSLFLLYEERLFELT